jgi:hypothetical protein
MARRRAAFEEVHEMATMLRAVARARARARATARLR